MATENKVPVATKATALMATGNKIIVATPRARVATGNKIIVATCAPPP